ncbi:MAG: pseudaminic acid synthase [Burkholderiales bacterium]|nr:pseudaminic acid synthase [Burkholderiales bacterium]
MKIAHKNIGVNHPPFIIAEMSGNHNQSLPKALQLVDAAHAAGAHALKLQTYKADTMTLNINDREFRISDKNSLWFGRTLYDLYEEASTPWEWHEEIFSYARSLGMIPFSTPFDSTSVDFLEKLDAPCYKIASFENTDVSLIKLVASTGKPIIISTGMATLAELSEMVQAARDGGCKDLILLKCTSTYPSLPINTNIKTIPHMREMFGCEVGLSDHTMGVGVSVASVGLGATVIEKHFTLARSDGGVDSAFSLEPHELNQLVVETERAWQALGAVNYGPTDAEKKSLAFRRTLYIVEDLQEGDILTSDNVRSIRPGLGLPVKHFDVILGKKVNRQVIRGTALHWDLIS